MKLEGSRLAASYGYCEDDAQTKAELLQKPSLYWDVFYKANKQNFFKDRHWLTREFPVLLTPDLVLCELGCGVGNTVFPLLAENPSLRVHCSDFSATAVDILRASPLFGPERVLTCSVADCTSVEQVRAAHPAESSDAVILIFVLSAMPPAQMRQVVQSCAAVLRRGGRALVRDYAHGDAAQIRFEQTPSSRQIDEHLCCRGDGTQAFFFPLDMFRALWEEAGFSTLECVERVTEAQATGGRLRRFVQGQFEKNF